MVAVTSDSGKLISGGCDGQVTHYAFCTKLMNIDYE